MSDLWTSVVAVGGTLLGGLLAAAAQAWAARTSRRAEQLGTRRADALAAVTALVSALADHRRAMWVLGDRRLAGADDQIATQAEEGTHVTRAAITAPLVSVRILCPTLGQAAQAATRATYAMRDAADLAELETLRASALAASDSLVDAAGELFASMGVHQ